MALSFLLMLGMIPAIMAYAEEGYDYIAFAGDPINGIQPVTVKHKDGNDEIIAYCFNHKRAFPTRVGVPTELKYKKSAATAENIDANLDDSVNNIYKGAALVNVLKVIAYNGYPNHKTIKEKFGLTDAESRVITQHAVWHFTNGMYNRIGDFATLSEKAEAVKAMFIVAAGGTLKFNDYKNLIDSSGLKAQIDGLAEVDDSITAIENEIKELTDKISNEASAAKKEELAAQLNSKKEQLTNAQKSYFDKTKAAIALETPENIALDIYQANNAKPAAGSSEKDSFQNLFAINKIDGRVPVPDVPGEPETTTVKFSKQDIAGKELAGATISLTSDKGDKQEWQSDGKGAHEFTVKEGKYTFEETAAPNGYKVATKITFEVVRNENTKALEITNVKVGEGNKKGTDGLLIMVDDYAIHEKPSKPSESGNSPKTGDRNDLEGWLFMGLSSLLGLKLVTRMKKRNA